VNQTTITTARLAAVRLTIRRALGIGSGHACEAVAAALGHNTHAALVAAARKGAIPSVSPHAARFRARLAELGHAIDAAAADTALAIAFGRVPEDAPDGTDLPKLLRIADCITGRLANLAIVNPEAKDIVLALQPIPDPTVERMAIGKDTLRWNPAYAEDLEGSELEFLLAAAAIHRACLHPLRQGARDPAFWAMACDHAVNDFLARSHIGRIPRTGLHDKRYPAETSPEGIYDRLVGETRMQPPPRAGFAFEPWKARPPARPVPVSHSAAGWFADRGFFGRSGLQYGADVGVLLPPIDLSVREAARHHGGRWRSSLPRDQDATAFGELLARKVAGLTQRERAAAVSRMIQDAMKACTDEVSLALVRDLSNDPRIGLREDIVDEVSDRYLRAYNI
jgi:hypothetical protein